MAGKTYRRFFQDGAASFNKGLRTTKCPYPAGSMEHRSWVDGWLSAEWQTKEAIRNAIRELRQAFETRVSVPG